MGLLATQPIEKFGFCNLHLSAYRIKRPPRYVIALNSKNDSVKKECSEKMVEKPRHLRSIAKLEVRGLIYA